jgi:hypothetical protein
LKIEEKGRGDTWWENLLEFFLLSLIFPLSSCKTPIRVCDPGQGQAKDESVDDITDF